MAVTTQRITPLLWFDNQAEEAVAFYTSIFKNSKVLTTARYTEEASQAAGRPAGSVMVVDFQLEGQCFTALNGGPHFKFNEASPSSSTASRRRKWTTTGTGYPRTATLGPSNAAG